MKQKDYNQIFQQRDHLYNEAISICPKAREAERKVLLDLCENPVNKKICDIPAGGGYLAEGVFNRFGQSNTIYCVEPSPVFSSSIKSDFYIVNSEMHTVAIQDKYFDLLLSLAGLHHCSNKNRIFREWHRIIKPHGLLAVADVELESGADLFLNGFVDKYNKEGHEGLFFSKKEMKALFINNGFAIKFNQVKECPWQFESEEQMALFCRKLFALEVVSDNEIIDALHDIVGVTVGEQVTLH